MLHFFHYGWAGSAERMALAVGITLAFAAVARAVRGVNFSGAVAGGLCCFLLLAGGGPGLFAALMALFAVTWVSTRLGYRSKAARGLAEPREGRDGWQVAANLAAAAGTATGFAITGERAWIVASVAALAEAAADTVASEIGEYRAESAWMITTWSRVPAGTDGGVTLAGSTAGLAAAVVVAAVAAAGRMWVAVAAGFAGMLVDSLLGATVQRRGWMSNQAVNLAATVAAAGIALLAVRFSLFAGR